MDKIDEATEVVCLLTQRSVERPWILYEAGVAKGKLGKKVIGIALGMPKNIAFTGPFAQFQNNDGTVESISKLVLELVRKVPGLDPDQQLVEQLVQSFHKKALEILAKNKEHTEESEEVTNENINTKLFEEIKIMFENLPSKIENRIDPDYKRRRRRFHPMMFEEIMHMGMEMKDPNLAFLILVSMYKDDFPWIYEVGLETYKGLNSSRNMVVKRGLMSNFEKALEMFSHPVMREFMGKSDDNFFFYKESRHLLHDFIERFYKKDENKIA